jgi:TPP-dependent pyruvate/acetoin dehydrogenase alpha subunit
MVNISHEAILKIGRYSNLSISAIDTEVVKSLYKFMLRLRRCEEAIIKEYHPADEMRCPVHFCIGQEALPAALSLLLTQDDYLFSHHRSHGYFLAKRAPMKFLISELYGRETGANGGKAGSQEISMPSVNFYSGAILAGIMAIAVGAALGFQLQHKSNIALAGFGDGAPDEGIFWEAINYAVLRKLPVIFLCENNRYSTYSHQLKRQVADNISRRVSAFGAKSFAIFGNDVIAVYSAVAEAINYTRKGEGPVFIETYTYRLNAHVGPEDDDWLGYRPKSELEFWKTNCPIALLEEQMIACGLLTLAVKERIVNEIDQEITDAFQFAKSSKFPGDINWLRFNYSNTSPLADSLLHETISGEFDENQEYTIPGPY